MSLNETAHELEIALTDVPVLDIHTHLVDGLRSDGSLGAN
jgi:hypothetical protein